MKRLLIGFVVAIALTAGAARPALAKPTTGPDEAVCIHVSGKPGFTNFVIHAFLNAGTCTSHP